MKRPTIQKRQQFKPKKEEWAASVGGRQFCIAKSPHEAYACSITDSGPNQASVAERRIVLPPTTRKEPRMASLFFTCPITDQQAPTGIETDVQSLQAAWKATLNVKCPHCGEVHQISVRETYINGALRDASDRSRWPSEAH
jgi:hypothetical protein